MSEDAYPQRRRKQLYGRRKGPKLSAHQASLFQTLLPGIALKLEPARDPRTYFDCAVDDVWLEVGFGAGEHLLWQAERHPHTGLIGAEPYEAGVAKLLSRLAAASSASQAQHLPHSLARTGEENVSDGATSFLPRAEHWGPRSGGGGLAHTNIRIYQNDARGIIDALPDKSLGRVFILFPDPWPKTRHHKRRFIQTRMLDDLARVMKPGSELRFASDDADYVAWTLERVIARRSFEWTATCASDWKRRPPDWPPTRYEEKALHGQPAFLRFLRK